MTLDECSRCGRRVPQLRFCVCCGEPFAEASSRRRRYAAAPHETGFVPHVVSTIFPQLPRRDMRAFRMALAVAFGAVLLAGVAGLYPVAVALSATTVPMLLALYLHSAGVYENRRWFVLALTVGWGIAAGALTAVVLRALSPSAVQTAVEGAGVSSPAILLVPVAGLLVAVLGTALVLLPYDRFNDLLDGTTFGAVTASYASATQVVILSLPLYSEGLRPPAATEPRLLRLVEIAFVVPLLWASVGATIAGSLWLRWRTVPLVRQSIGPIGSPLVAIPAATGLLLCVALARLWLGEWSALFVMLAALVLALAHLRWLIHAGLVNDVLLSPIGPEATCANCGRLTPTQRICGECGVARRALPKELNMPDGDVSVTAPAAHLGAVAVLGVTIGALAFAAASSTAITTLLIPDTLACREVICEEPFVLFDRRNRASLHSAALTGGVSLSYVTPSWHPIRAFSDTIELAFASGGTLAIKTLSASDARQVFDERVSDLRVEHADLGGQGPARQILGGSIANKRAVAGAFCASVESSPQDLGQRVDIVLLAAVAQGVAVRAEITSDGCGVDAQSSPLFQQADAVLNTIRWPVAGRRVFAQPVTGALEPNDLDKVYELGPFRDKGLRGQGQTIAVIVWAGLPLSDIAAFDREFGIDGPPVAFRGPTGLAEDHEDVSGGRAEANLDIQVLRAVAPEARIIAYHAGPLMSDLVAVLERVVDDGDADVVSISGGICDVESFASGHRALSATLRARGERVLMRAVEQGVTAFVSSGDSGAYACQQRERTDHRVTTKWPTGSPNVVSVGGTLVRGNPAAKVSESGWQSIVSFAGSGGGANPVDARPGWQRAPGLPAEALRRLIPDVSASGSPESGYAIVHEGELVTVGGTSGAAPFWAALFSLIEQYVTRREGAEVGFAAPVLYEVARSEAGASAFRDVVEGGNRLYPAVRGWDAATGLGAPNGWQLAQAIARARQLRPGR